MKKALAIVLISIPVSLYAQEKNVQVQPSQPLAHEPRSPVQNVSELPHAQPNDISNAKIDRLEKNISALEKQISAMNMATPSSGEQAARANASYFAQIEDMKEQLKHMRGDIEQIQFENARLNERFVKFTADMEFRFNELSKPQGDKKKDISALEELDKNLDDNVILRKGDNKKDSDKKEEKAGADKTDKSLPEDKSKKDITIEKKDKKSSVEQEYQDAYSLLKAKDFKGARTALQKFVDEHPDSEYTGNAYYWLGETYYLRAEYDKGAVYYLKGYQNNIRGSRAADNLLKLAKSLVKLEKKKEACTTYAKLKKEFPNANNSIKKQLEDDIKDLKCQL